jgi:hypothetical protein
MGSLAYDESEPTRSEPIFGSLDNDRVALIMRVEHRADEWRFRDEVPALNRREARCETWYDSAGQCQTARWYRETVRVSTQQRKIAKGNSLALAVYPYSTAQIDIALFKRGSQKGSLDRPDVARLRFANEGEFLQWTESHPWDYWETGRHLVAGISRPKPLQDLRGKQRRPRESEPYRLVFGLCESDCQALARELARSPRGLTLLERVEKDRLKFWFRPATLKMKNIPRLSSGIKEQAEHLLDLAIRLALAGPVTDSESWFGKPVMDLAEQILTTILNNHNRVANHRDQRHTKLSNPDELPDKPNRDSDSDEFEEDNA